VVLFEHPVPLAHDPVDALDQGGVCLVDGERDRRRALAYFAVATVVVGVGVGDHCQRGVGESPPVLAEELPVRRRRGVDDARGDGDGRSVLVWSPIRLLTCGFLVILSGYTVQ